MLDFLRDESKNKDVDAISDFVEKIKNQMLKEDVNVRDYEAFLVFTSVLKKSSEFWLPKKLGGQGQYAYYKNTLKRIVYMSNSENSNSESAGDDDKWRRCLSDVLEADGMSASIGFIISAGVAAGSGGTLAIPALIGVAIESGATSAWAYYRSSNC